MKKNVSSRSGEHIRTPFVRIVDDNNLVWAVYNGLISCLLQINMESKEIRCLGELPIDYSKDIRYSAIGKIDDKIIIAPYYCKSDFLEFDLINHNIRKIPLKYDISSKYGTFTSVIKYDQSLFFVGNVNNTIVEYRAKTEEYIYHFKWAEDFKMHYKERIFLSDCECIGDILYLPLFGTNIIITLRISTCELLKVVTIPFEFEILATSYNGTDVWFAPLNGNKIVKWETDRESFKVIEVPIDENIVRPFKAIVFMHKKILLVPNSGLDFFAINESVEIIETIANPEIQFTQESIFIGKCKETCDGKNSECVYLFSPDNVLQKIKNGTDIVSKCLVDVVANIIKPILDRSRIERTQCIVLEGMDLDLGEFTDICRKLTNKGIEQDLCGKVIHRYIIQQ